VNTLIKNWAYKDYTHDIDGVAFVLNPEWKKIAVSISGGADSAMLAYILCDLIVKNNLKIQVHIISNIRMWKTRPWQKWDSLNVYYELCVRFPTIEFIRHENFIAPDIEYGNIGPIIKDEYGHMKSGDQISVRSHAEYVCFTQKINAWFAGITKNPPLDSITLKPDDRNDELTEENIHLLVDYQQGIYVCHPFRFTSKDWIIRQYKNFNLENLLSKTRSCEGDTNTFPEIFKGLDYRTYTPGQQVPSCGKCFWCQERNWALSQ